MIFLKKILFGFTALGAALIGVGVVNAATLTVSCGAVGKELELCKRDIAEWSEKTGHEAKVISTPNSSTERLALYQQLLAAKAPDIDVFQVDIVWPGILGSHFIDLKEYAGDRISEYFPAIVQNNTVEGQLVAMPLATDAGIMYYRKDLLEKHGEEAPTTWEDLTRIAQKIQSAEREAGNDKLWGFVWQGRAYEGLTCNALEWVASYGGGTIVDQDGKITINNPDAAAAIDHASGWVGTVTPEGVLNYTEEEARGIFQSGNAVFMRNWPYAWSLANSPDSPVKDKVGVVVLPKGAGEDARHAATLGGWNLSVSKYSKHPDIAADLVMYMTSAEVQKRRAIEASNPPTIESLYKDEEVLAAVPFFGDLYNTLVNAVARPSAPTGSKYNEVSSNFWNAVHVVLAGNMSAEESLNQLESKLMRMSRGGRAWR